MGLADVGAQDVLVLCLFALLAGALDAVVGGGGLVQLPALLVVLPQAPVVALLGTNKLASVVGTASAAVTYSRRVAVDRRTAVWMAGSAFVGSGGEPWSRASSAATCSSRSCSSPWSRCSSTPCAARRSARSSCSGCGPGSSAGWRSVGEQ